MKNIIKNDVKNVGYFFLDSLKFNFDEKIIDSFYLFKKEYDDLPLDKYIKGKFKYRYRRYSEVIYDPIKKTIKKANNNYFLQNKDQNKLYGGVKRKFENLKNKTIKNTFLNEIINIDFNYLPIKTKDLKTKWKLGIHLIRIISKIKHPGIPAPEGVHHDGHQFIAQHLIDKKNVIGGHTVFCDKNNLPFDGAILDNSLDTIYVNDKKVKHFATPIKTLNRFTNSFRDILLIDFNQLQ